jgi:hypothetical protein
MKSQKNGEATMSNKHSSIEWLVEKIQQANPSFKFDGLKRQAKAMHKDEICKSYVYGAAYRIDVSNGLKHGRYYNETYGGE